MFKELYRCIFLMVCLFTTDVYAKITPGNGDTVNYRLVPFSIVADNRFSSYTIEVAEGNYTEEKLFKSNIITTSNSTDARWVEEVPLWGKHYTWQVTYMGRKKKNNIKTELYHFYTGPSVYTDTSKYRVRIIDSATRYKDMFVIVDYAPIMFDMKGNVVWYIPDIPGKIGTGSGIRDLKPTSTGTITTGGIEVDYNGKMLWKAPDKGTVSGDTTESYHHEFTKLESGNYMIAGMQRIMRRVPADADTTHYITDNTITRKNGWFYKTVDCATLIEYNAKGEIVWSWKLSEHFDDREYFIRTNRNGTYNSTPHLNSFDFDEKNKVIYASLRNCDRIIKIKYPEGQIIAQYGEYLDSNGNIAGEKLFHAQHCVKRAPNGNLLVFNNNTSREKNVTSYISVFQEPADGKSNLRKIWEFGCDIDTNAPRCGLGGGSVHHLPDGSILAGMGMAGRCFIVSSDKKIIWNAIPEMKTDTGIWRLLTVYRNTCILNKEKIFAFIKE